MPVVDVRGVSVPYRLIRTPRTRRISVRVGPTGVTVTGPRGCTHARAERALMADADWLHGALRRVALRFPPPVRPGDTLPLLGGGLLLHTGPPGARTHRGGDLLVVAADRDLRAAVERWYRARAREHFAHLVDEWAPRIGARPARLSIGGQRARWGSASARGRVSLNWRLMLAPVAVGEYVVVHELCHLVHMDHSPRFWALVAHHLPQHRVQREWLHAHGPALLSWLREPPPVR